MQPERKFFLVIYSERVYWTNFITTVYLFTTGIATLGGSSILYAARAWGDTALARTFPVVLIMMGVGFLLSFAIVAVVAWHRHSSLLKCLAFALPYALVLVLTFLAISRALRAVFPWLTSVFGAPPPF